MKKYVILVLVAVLTVIAASSACRPLRVARPGEGALVGISPEYGEELEREFNESRMAGN